MSANNTQVGGNHYSNQYQHWDFICDTGLHYIPANATKYISRWRKKNGIQDLEKAKHYISKAIECDIEVPISSEFVNKSCKFAEQLHTDDSLVFLYIANGYYQTAIEIIDDMILDHTQQEQIAAIRKRDNDDYIRG